MFAGKVAGGHGKIHEFVDREAILWHRFAALVPPVALLPYQVVPSPCTSWAQGWTLHSV